MDRLLQGGKGSTLNYINKLEGAQLKDYLKTCFRYYSEVFTSTDFSKKESRNLLQWNKESYEKAIERADNLKVEIFPFERNLEAMLN